MQPTLNTSLHAKAPRASLVCRGSCRLSAPVPPRRPCCKRSTARGQLRAGTVSLLAPPHPPCAFADLHLCPLAVTNSTCDCNTQILLRLDTGCTSWKAHCCPWGLEEPHTTEQLSRAQQPGRCWHLINGTFTCVHRIHTYLSDSLDLNVI